MVNFDGTVQSATAGFVIRNHEGASLRVGREKLSHRSVPYAEMIGTWLGLLTVCVVV